jgi:hypothetical protein
MASALILALIGCTVTHAHDSPAVLASPERNELQRPAAFGAFPGGLFAPPTIDHMAKSLGLQTEQVAQIKALSEQAQTRLEPLHKQLRANAELLANTQPDTSNFQALVEANSRSTATLVARLIVTESELRSAIWHVLNAEQRRQFLMMHKEKMERWAQNRADQFPHDLMRLHSGRHHSRRRLDRDYHDCPRRHHEHHSFRDGEQWNHDDHAGNEYPESRHREWAHGKMHEDDHHEDTGKSNTGDVPPQQGPK